MKLSILEIKKSLPKLGWAAEELADQLSAIGFEAEPIDEESLNVTLTSNRKDCQELLYLLFDLAGAYPELRPEKPLITFGHGQPVPVTMADVNKLLGADVTDEQYKKLENIGFAVETDKVTPPDFRTDIKQKADIAEEVVRINGFEIITIQPLSEQAAADSPTYRHIVAIKKALADKGLTETSTYSFTKEGQIELKNPFNTEEAFLRPSSRDGLLKTLARNPYLKRIGFFEVGAVFSPEEEIKIGVILAGYKNPEGQIQSINEALGTTLDFQPIGLEILSQFEVKETRVVWAEVSIGSVKPAESNWQMPAKISEYRPISKFPPLVRDISLPATKSGEFTTQVVTIPELLLWELIDSYTSPETQAVTDTFRLIFQKLDQSFTDQAIQKIDEQLVQIAS